MYPPVIEHQPSACGCWITGNDAPGAASPRVPPAALPHAPAEVDAARAAAAHEVDLLDRVLPDVADHEVAGRAVEREAPGVAQTVGVDLAARAGLAGERVAGGTV